MNNQLNSINSNESPKHLFKSQKFVENAKRAVRKALTSAWIAASTMGPMAATSTATFVPASVNTITAVVPTATTVVKAISLWTAASLLTACGGSEDGPDGPIEVKDTTAPTINVSKSEVDITWWKEVRISGNQLYIWSEIVASRSDNKTKNCSVLLSINWKAITSWTTISEEWTLTIKVSDEAWNIKSSDIRLNKAVDQDISWLENLKNLNMQVDQEVNLLNWVTFGNGASLEKVEIEIDWQRVEVSDPYHYIPSYPWVCNIIITVKDKNSKSTEYKVDNLTIKALEYKAMDITNINPETLMPKVEAWDKNIYKHIEHLRIPESTVITDMMWKYGAGNYSPEEYQQLMSRLNTGMINETPYWYNNYEQLWSAPDQPSYHAHDEWHILNTLIKHANLKVVNPQGNRHEILYNFTKSNENSINIFWKSTSEEWNREWYLKQQDTDNIKKLLKTKNFIIFWAGTNIRDWSDWVLKNKIYQENVNTNDKHWIYWFTSTANWKNDNNIDRHLLVTIWTNAYWDIDQTNQVVESSKYPVWFHDKILFAWRAFPYLSWSSNVIRWEAWKYATSYTNYFNVAIADILFQMKADTPDVDEFLETVRSTALTDYIRFDLNGDGDTNDIYDGQPETQPLLLMNPSWFFKKYLMPTDLPSSIQVSKTTTLNKWYYKWVIFDIPWAEVKINWQWIVYNETNKSQIKSQNPMSLEWRFNWDLCRKLWYKWKTVQWKIIVVDDKWNGLNIDKEFFISIQ